jgi:hypothetical protein
MTNNVPEPMPIQILCDIIRAELVLNENQVLVYNQKWDIPPNEDLYVSLSIISAIVYCGSNVQSYASETGYTETKTIQKLEIIGIDIMSKGIQALLRRYEIIIALQSVYSQQQQEKYNIKICRLPINFIDLSYLEGAARLNRYHASVHVYSTLEMTKSINYFDTYSYLVKTNK